MTKLLEEIYYGVEGGFDSLVRGKTEYQKALRTYQDSRSAFEKMLPAELLDMFHQCLTCCKAASDVAEETAFGYGIRFGVEFMWELLCPQSH